MKLVVCLVPSQVTQYLSDKVSTGKSSILTNNDLGKCSASRGTSYVILCLECYPNIWKAGMKQSVVIHLVKVTHPLIYQ